MAFFIIWGASWMFLAVNTVLSWNLMPSSLSIWQASTVRSKVPGMPRKASWLAAVPPSRDIDSIETPASWSPLTRSRVNSGVTEGETETCNPLETP